jgi:hypothetical protein
VWASSTAHGTAGCEAPGTLLVCCSLLYLVLHQPGPYLAWKGFEWATLDRLHAKGLIGDPKNKNKSVALTDEGVTEAVAFQRVFGVGGDSR